MTLADIRPGLRAYVLADAGIAAVAGVRMYTPVLLQGEKRPSIVYSRISGLGGHTMQGPDRLSRPRIQIDCWAEDADTAALLADLVKERVDGFRGLIEYGTGSPPDSVFVQGIFFADRENDDYDADGKLYRTSRDYFVWYEER